MRGGFKRAWKGERRAMCGAVWEVTITFQSGYDEAELMDSFLFFITLDTTPYWVHGFTRLFYLMSYSHRAACY